MIWQVVLTISDTSEAVIRAFAKRMIEEWEPESSAEYPRATVEVRQDARP